MLTLLTTTSTGTGIRADSDSGSLSRDGTKLVFISDAEDLVSGDTNGKRDVFVKDLKTGVVTRVSTSSNGGQADARSYDPQITPDGSKVIFLSGADNLVAGGEEGNFANLSVYVKDLKTGAIERIASNVTNTAVLSADGTKVAYLSERDSGTGGRIDDLFIKNLVTGAVTRASIAADGTLANGSSYGQFTLSSDGTKVAFFSSATNLVAGDVPGETDFFVKDLASGVVTRVASATKVGESRVDFGPPDLSPDGSKVVFVRYGFKESDSLSPYDQRVDVTVYVQDLKTGEQRAIASMSDLQAYSNRSAPKFSPDGKTIVYETFEKDDYHGGYTTNLNVLDLTSAEGPRKLDIGNSWSGYDFSPDGRRIIFTTRSDFSETGDRNNCVDVYASTLPFDPPAVKSVSVTAPNTIEGPGVVTTGQNVIFELALTQYVGVRNGGGFALKLNSGGRAFLDYSASSPDKLVFKYNVRPDEVTADIQVVGIDPNGGTLKDNLGQDVNFSGAFVPIAGTLAVNGYVGSYRDDKFGGTTGAETFVGGNGNDLYLVNNPNDHVIEFKGEGKDTVVATLSYSLLAGQEIETLQLATATGKANLNLVGNEFGQTLSGNGGANVLDGKGGADTLIGKGGDDTYGVDTLGDRVIEAVGGGNDAVITTVSYALTAGQEIERLQLASTTGKANLALIGNEFGQTLRGNDGGNVLNGKAGLDTLIGRGGSDTFIFDTALGPQNVDHIVDFSHADDTIQLSRAIFSIGGDGRLPAEWFKDVGAAGAVVDGDDRILYDSRDGALYYDSNGSAAGGRTQFAVLDNHAKIDHTDFLIV